MSLKYPHLLSPFKIGNVVFKNRMLAAPARPHFSQGAETFPTEALITSYSNKARNGAALVTIKNIGLDPIFDDQDAKLPSPPDINPFNPGRKTHMGGRHNPPLFNMDNGHTQNYISMLTETVHFYGALAHAQLDVMVPRKWDVSKVPPHETFGAGWINKVGEPIPAEMLDQIADEYARHAYRAKELGFDGAYIYMCYRTMLMGRFLSPLTNKRTDKFGGSLENRARFPLMVADRIRQKCGKDFILEGCISGEEPHGGYTLDDAVQFAKLFSGHYDLLQLRAGEIDPAHPAGFNLSRTPFLYMAEAIKKSGADIKVVTVGGYLDLDISEEIIASGKADFISMARAWICNPELGKIAYEGRNEDIVPCLRCNACHVSSYFKPWVTTCSVNPAYGFEHKIERMISPPADKKKVAVVGGGPAGLEAALVASGRGHQVTLYEKSDELGGLFHLFENVSFKWPHKDFKNYLVRQIKKAGVNIKLNTEATPEMIKAEGYNAVLVAVGADPVVLPIPGAKGKNVVYARNVFGHEDALKKNVVIIGGGAVGVETGMHLAEKGHQVTVLEMTDMLARDATPIHFYSLFRAAWEKLPNFHFILKVRCTGISADKVTYIDGDGKQQSIAAGSVVMAVGMQAKNDLALQFFDSADLFFIIGDCKKAGDVQMATRSAYAAASSL